MRNLKYENVRIKIVDPEIAPRDSLKNILRLNGFRNIEHGSNIDDVISAAHTADLDLLLCATHFPEGNPSSIINKLRHNELGLNPFLPIIMMTAEPNPKLVAQVINSGADDLLLKPFSAAQVLDRVNALINARKPFIVTTDYVGPDRRKGARKDENSPIQQIEVPNTLRAKATGKKLDLNLQRTINEALAAVNQQKLERHAVQIGCLVEMILPALVSRKIDKILVENVGRLLFVAEDTSRRLAGTKYGHVSELCNSLISVTTNIQDNLADPTEKDVMLMRPLSQAIGKAFDINEDVAALARRISAQIKKKSG